MPDPNLAGLRIHHEPKHLPAWPAGQHHLPTQSQRRPIYRQPHQPCRGLAHRFADIISCEGNRLCCRYRRLAGFELAGIGRELIADVHEFAVFRRVRDEHALENRHAVHLLFPNDRAHLAVRIHEVPLHRGVGQDGSIMPEQPGVLVQEILHGLVGLLRPGEEAVRRAHPLRTAKSLMPVHAHGWQACVQLPEGFCFLRGWRGSLGSEIEIGQRRQRRLVKSPNAAPGHQQHHQPTPAK